MANEILLFLTPPISREKDILYLVIFNNAKVLPTLSTKKKWEGEGAWSYVQSAYEKKKDCNNCTKFQFYTEKVFGDIPYFVILQHFCVHNVTSQVISFA